MKIPKTNPPSGDAKKATTNANEAAPFKISPISLSFFPGGKLYIESCVLARRGFELVPMHGRFRHLEDRCLSENDLDCAMGLSPLKAAGGFSVNADEFLANKSNKTVFTSLRNDNVIVLPYTSGRFTWANCEKQYECNQIDLTHESSLPPKLS